MAEATAGPAAVQSDREHLPVPARRGRAIPDRGSAWVTVGKGGRWNRVTKRFRFKRYIPGAGGRSARTLNGTARTIAEATARYFTFVESLGAKPDVTADRTPEPTPVQTFAEFAGSGWIKVCESAVLRGKMKDGTVRFYRYALASILPRIGSTRLDLVTATVVDDLVTDLLRTGKSATTAREYAQVVRRVLRAAVKRGEIREDPIRGEVELPSASRPTLELSRAEHRAILAALQDRSAFERVAGKEPTRDRIWDRHVAFAPLVVAAIETGMRKSDLIALRWRAVSEPDAVIRFVQVKTSEPITIPISDRCAAALKVAKARSIRSVSGLVFLDAAGLPWTKQKVQDAFLVLKRVAGITRRLRFHDLRHTYACNLVSAGASLPVVGSALGHRDHDSTARYARVAVDAVVEQIRAAQERAAQRD